jgi:hypothetical protein
METPSRGQGGGTAGRDFSARAAFFGKALALTLVIFGLGLLLHEGLHLVVIRALGADGVLVVRPWRLSLLGWQIYGLHAQPLTPLSPTRQFVVNLAGPTLAAVPFALLLWRIRSQTIRIALAINVGILVFYGVIEALYVVLESDLGLEGDWLTVAELNYGLPLLITVAVLAGRSARLRR